MVDAGAAEVQLDAPSESIACAHGTHPVDELAEWIARPLVAAGSATRTVHFCLGDIARRPSTNVQNLRTLLPLVQALEGHVDRVLLECSYPGRWQERELLADVPDDVEVVAGLADVKAAPASVDDLSERTGALLDVVAEERLLVTTSCGCGRMPHDDAIRMVLNLVRAAHRG